MQRSRVASIESYHETNCPEDEIFDKITTNELREIVSHIKPNSHTERELLKGVLFRNGKCSDISSTTKNSKETKSSFSSSMD